MKTKNFLLTIILAGITWDVAAATEPPIACNMKALTAKQRTELALVGKHVISAIADSRELSDGYAFRVDAAKASLMDVAQWLDLWRLCCPFYDFQVDIHAVDATIWLSVKGRPGVKEYIPVDSPRLAEKLRK